MLRFRALTATAALTASVPLRLASADYSKVNPPHRGADGVYRSMFPSVMPVVEKERTLYEYMRKRWAAAPQDKRALLQAETGIEYSFGELGELTERTGQYLYHVGDIRPGDCVCIAMLNNVHYPPLVYGTLSVGGCVSTINAVADAATVAYHLRLNKAKVLLTMKFFAKTMEEAVELVRQETGNTIKILFPEEFMRSKDREPLPAGFDPLKDADPHDTVFLPFSSGSTGAAKAVQLTNRNLIANVEQSKGVIRAGTDDVSISVLPFFHIFGFTCCLNTVLSVGATQIVMMKYSSKSFIDTIEKYKVTLSLVAPPILVSLTKSAATLKGRDLSSLKYFRSGSAPLTAEMERECEALFPGTSIGQGYGMTEMSPVVTALPTVETKGRTYGSSGKLLPDTEMRIVLVDDDQQSGDDSSKGADAPEGKDGEVWFRGPQMMKGYTDEKQTKGALQDGWYRTGDIGHYDPKTGDLVITDRLKELIKYKGFQVSPASMEGVLLEHPWVKDCIVIGVPDPRDVSFENPRALVTLNNLSREDSIRASDEIQRFVMSRLPPHKRLHGGVRVVDEIPRNAAGKVLRRQIRHEEIAYLKGLADGTIKPGSPSRVERLKKKANKAVEYTGLLRKYAKLLWMIQKEKMRGK